MWKFLHTSNISIMYMRIQRYIFAHLTLNGIVNELAFIIATLWEIRGREHKILYLCELIKFDTK
jgi:hypothetical protein